MYSGKHPPLVSLTHRAITSRGQSLVVFFFEFEPFADRFWLSAFHVRIYQLV